MSEYVKTHSSVEINNVYSPTGSLGDIDPAIKALIHNSIRRGRGCARVPEWGKMETFSWTERNATYFRKRTGSDQGWMNWIQSTTNVSVGHHRHRRGYFSLSGKCRHVKSALFSHRHKLTALFLWRTAVPPVTDALQNRRHTHAPHRRNWLHITNRTKENVTINRIQSLMWFESFHTLVDVFTTVPPPPYQNPVVIYS